MKKFLLFLLLTLLTTPPVTAADNDAFTEAQKKELGSLIDKHLLANPDIIVEVMTLLQKKAVEEAKKQQEEMIAKNKDKLNDAKAPFLGRKNAKYVLTHFFDYNCPYCRKVSSSLLKLVDERKDVRIVMKDSPIFGDDSLAAAKGSLFAAKNKKFREYYLEMTKDEDARNDLEAAKAAIKAIGLDVAKFEKFAASDEMDAGINENQELAQEVGASSLPATLFGTEMEVGAFEPEAFIQLFDNYLERLKEDKEAKKNAKKE